MTRRHTLVALSLMLGVSASASSQTIGTASSADRALAVKLGWMTGCWAQRTPNGSLVEEQWLAPRAGTMLGLGRTTRGDSALVEYEQLRIFAHAGRIVYHAAPSGQTPADFAAIGASDTLVVFENPAHDFPQRVIYRRRGADSLLARVEGTANGKTRGVDFPYARVACAAQATTSPRR